MDTQITNAIMALKNIRFDLDHDRVSYEQAKKLAQPHIDIINAKAESIAREFKKKPTILTFTAAMRGGLL